MLSCCYQLDLARPKQTSLRVTINKEKLNKIQDVVKTFITNQTQSDLKKLFDEGALISRMCCKVKKKFRGEKLFRRLKQITISLRKLYQLNIFEVQSILLSTFEHGMPSKQVGQWAGTRILAATNLLNQLQQFCEEIAQLIVKVFQNGQCWLEMNIALAMVSRVWILTKSLFKSFLQSYQQYRPIVNQLKMAETEWLPSFELPENLIENSYSESEEELVEKPGSVMCRKPESEKPSSVMCRKPEPEKSITKKRKRPGKQIRILQEKRKHKINVMNNCKKQKLN